MARIYAEGPAATTVASVEAAPSGWRHFSWGAVLAGASIALAVQVGLSLLGIGIGMSTVEPASEGMPRADAITVGAAVWWIVSTMIAAAIGGWVAAFASGYRSTGEGVAHAMVSWAIGLLVTGLMPTTALGALAGGAFTVLGGAVQGAAQGAVQRPGTLTIEQRVDDLMRPSVGGVSAEASRGQLIVAMRQMTLGSEAEMQQGYERSIAALAAQPGMDDAQARARVDRARDDIRRNKEDAKIVAEQSAKATAGASFWGFVCIVLAAIAAWLGGALGTRDYLVYYRTSYRRTA
jgi:hypothetical protein